MGKPKLEKFSVATIARVVKDSGERSARVALSFAFGAVLDVSGKVRKVVKRENLCKLVIEPGDVPGFVVFADFMEKLETIKDAKIRKGSLVSVRGKLRSFGMAAVCLSECQIQR